MNGLVKTINDGEGGKIKLAGSAMTFILYKSYFGRDLLNDIVTFAKQSADAETVARLGQFNVRTADDIAALNAQQRAVLFSANYKFDSEFVLNFITALIATARYPEKVDATEIIMEIPPWWIADSGIVAELMEFLSLFISHKKAGGAASAARFRRR
jgi:hypothetical protein